MSDISEKREATGRPLTCPARTFVAVLLAKVRGVTHERALELIEEDPDVAPGLYWSLAAVAASEGLNSREEFEAYVRDALSERLKTPVL